MFHFTVILAKHVQTVCLGCRICNFFILLVLQISLIKCRVVSTNTDRCLTSNNASKENIESLITAASENSCQHIEHEKLQQMKRKLGEGDKSVGG